MIFQRTMCTCCGADSRWTTCPTSAAQVKQQRHLFRGRITTKYKTTPLRPSTGTFQCYRMATSRKRDLFTTTGSLFSDKRKNMEELWLDFFSDPSQWWDSRSEKVNPRYPDFKHKMTQESLWVNGKFNPHWVEAKLAAMAPGTVQEDIFTWNNRLARYVEAGQYKKTMELFEQMQQEGMNPNNHSFFPVLKACSNLRALEEGRRIHTQIVASGYGSDVFVGSGLIDMYAKCRSIEDAQGVFNEMSRHDVVAWNTLILGYVKCGQGQKALELSQQMYGEGVKPNSVTFLALLNACASVAILEEGKRVHQQVIHSGFEHDVFIGNSLVDMYAKCGSLVDAWRAFNKMPRHDVIAWNAIILGHVNCGQGQKALELFWKMHGEGVEPQPITFVGALNACASIVTLKEGKRVHEQIIKRNCESDIFIANSLINMYAKCGSIQDARRVFNSMQEYDVVSWSAMIVGYVKSGEGQKALELYQRMQKEGVEPDRVTFLGVVNACASLGAIEEGRRVHAVIIQRGYRSDVFVGSCLVDMYAKCESIAEAWRVFNEMPICNVVSWNAMIHGFVKCGEGQKALALYPKMEQKGVDLDSVTFVGLLNACASVGALNDGRSFHRLAIESGCESNLFIGNALVDMYAKCGSIEDAWRAFNRISARDVVSWNAMIVGLVNCGHGQKALELFRRMDHEGVKPDPLTFVALLNACASVGSFEDGRRVHQQIIQSSCESDIYVSNSLVDMYAKCGSIEDAQMVFNNIPKRNVVSWNVMIQGSVNCGEGQNGLDLSRQMELESVDPDPLTFVGILNACTSVAALQEGRCVHQQIIRSGCESNPFVGSSLVEMYAKCGSLEDACSVFNKIPIRDAVSWTAMLGGYAVHGHAEEALRHFEQMCEENVEINAVTFVSLLSACSHGGLLAEGLHYFESMSLIHSVRPTKEHYSCIVDLLGRAGRLHEAEDLIKSSICESDASVWMCLLGACRVQEDLDMGERVARRILKLNPGNAASHVLLSNIYAAAGKWDSSVKLRQQTLQSL